MEAPLAALTAVFLRIGNLTFGGGGPTVAAFQRELVARRKWLSQEQYGFCYALSRITPGTNLFAFCTAAGWLLRGWRGGILALLVTSVPSCVLVALLTVGFDSWSQNRWVAIGIEGALAATVGMLLATFWIILRPYVTRTGWRRTALIAGASIALSLGAGLSPIPVLALAAIAGWFWPEAQDGVEADE
jgi:chromate transporter